MTDSASDELHDKNEFELAAMLALFDEARRGQAGSDSAGDGSSILTPDAMRRLGQARDCLQMLDRLRPRGVSAGAHRVDDSAAPIHALSSEEQALLRLLRQEMQLRERTGNPVRLEEYLERFPQYSEYLRQQYQSPSDWSTVTVGASASESPLTERGGPARSPQPPAVAGYEIIEELGRGGMGVVYKARHVPLKRLVALKMILAGSHAGPQHLARFRIEAEAAARLQHPNIVQIYETGEQDGRPYLAFEYLSGVSLAAKLRASLLAPRHAAELIETLARAIHFAHGRGIVHRDLKPSNVLLELAETTAAHTDQSAQDIDRSSLALACPLPTLRPKITDFGLAKLLEEDGHTKSGDLVGTASHMAPEQASGDVADIGPATDTYALGVMLYESLTGRPPFRAPTTLETIRLIVQEDPVPPSRLQPRVPRDLETICLKCLMKSPRWRYATAAELADDLRRFLDGRPITARRTSAPERAAKWIRRHPVAASYLIATAAAVVVLLAMWLKFTTDLREQRNFAQHMAEHAQAQRREAEHHRAEAERQQSLALDSLEQARATAAESFQLVRDDVDLKRQGLEPLRLRLLQQATHLQEQLLADYRDQPDLHADVSRAYQLQAQLAYDIGSPDQVLELIEKAIRIVEELHARHPDNIDFAIHLGTCYLDHAFFLKDQSRTAESETQFKKAIALLETTPDRAAPEQRHPLMWRLGRGRFSYGTLLRQLDRLDEAETQYRAALAAIDESLTIHQVPDYLDTRAAILDSLGVLYSKTSRDSEAEQAYRAAIKIREQLLIRTPGYPSYEQGLAAAYSNLAQFLETSGRYEDTLDTLTLGLTVAKRLTETHPQVPRYAHRHTSLRGRRAAVLARVGRYREAITEVESAIDSQGTRGNVLFDAARAYSFAASAAARDPELTPLEQPLRAAQLADRALELLARCDATGHFQDPSVMERLKKSTAFDLLRTRPEFHQFIDNPSPRPAK